MRFNNAEEKPRLECRYIRLQQETIWQVHVINQCVQENLNKSSIQPASVIGGEDKV